MAPAVGGDAVLRGRIRWALWGLMSYLALLTALGSYNYVTGDPSNFAPLFRAKYTAHLALVMTHGVAGVTALALGPLQFWPWLRRRFRRVHRVLGGVYLLSVLISGVTGFPMGGMAFGGPVSAAGFCMLSVLWLASGWLAWTTALRGRIRQHAAWMTRNYALTFGAVMIRVYLSVFVSFGCDFTSIYPLVSWLGWVPNLVLAEWLIRRRK